MQESRDNGLEEAETRGYQFGAFKGVFTPSILTVLGVIMFLRVGWVLGNVGLPATLLIVTMASAVTFLTSLSLSALATNKKVRGGGAYYIISRSLGIEIGSAVGLPLFCAQALSIAFYVAGFSEAVVVAFPVLDATVVGIVTLVVISVLAYVSADLALKTQFVVLGLVVAALVSFFAGGKLDPAIIATGSSEIPLVSFWPVFAVFFPAVTGIMVGLGMSGDLKRPSRAIPLGTIGAVVVGYVVYMAIPIFMAWAAPDRTLLVSEPLIMQRMARWGIFILLGVWSATISSAMGSLLAAPRTLQALARDKVVPPIFGRGFGKGGDPRIATAFTFIIALVTILAGGLNAIAPVLTMFFLATYGVLNISAGLEELVGPPSWRPTFRVSSWVSLVGAFACFAVMFMINPGATIVACVVLTTVYYIMKRRQLRVQWGDVRYGIMMMTSREVLYRLAQKKPSERTWQPNILVFSGAPTKRWYLIQMANVLSRGRCFITLATVLPGGNWSRERRSQARNAIESYLKKQDIEAFVKVLPHEDPIRGVRELVASYGFGPIEPNVILLGETQKPENFGVFTELIRLIYNSHRNLILVRENKMETDAESTLHTGSRIDVWWRGEQSNIGLMFTLAYLMKRSEGWADARLVVKRIVDESEDRDEHLARLRAYVESQRVEAEVEIVVRQAESVFETIRKSSRGADLVFCGLRHPRVDESPESYQQYYEKVMAGTNGLPPTALVLTSEDIDFHRLFDVERA